MIPLTLLLVAQAATSACLATGGDSLTAGDLARAVPAFARLPATTIVGWAPVPGASRVLAAPELWRLAQQHGLTLPRLERSLAPRVCFTQAATPLPAATFDAALAEALPAQAPEDGWQIEVEDWTRAALPPGKLRFDRRALPRLPRSPEIRPVVWRGVLEAGSRRYPVWVKVRLSVERQRVEARTRIPAGEPLTSQAVMVTKAREYPLWPVACQSIEQTQGQQARRSLSPGDAIGPGDLRRAPDIRRGDPVIIAVAAGPARLEIRALAEASARTGQIVLVKNPLNGRRFPARITAPGRAEAITPEPVTITERENP